MRGLKRGNKRIDAESKCDKIRRKVELCDESPTAPKKKRKVNNGKFLSSPKTRLSPCMASQRGNMTLSGISGKHNRYTKRTELEMFTRRKRQRERMVLGVKQIADNNQYTMQMVMHQQSVHTTGT